MFRNARCSLALAVAAVLLGLAAALADPAPAAAGAKLEAAAPDQNARSGAALSQLDLFFTEPLSAAAVRLFDERGEEVLLDAAVAAADGPNHVIVPLPAGLGEGAWTVGWTVRSSLDGMATSGLYSFRVGPDPLPGSAAIDSEWPRPWAIAARWLAFLGLALAAGAFLLARLAAPSLLAPRGDRGSPAWLGIGAVSATLALLMLALTPVLAALVPAGAEAPPSVSASFRSMPPGFLACLAATLLIALLMLALLASGRHARLPGWVDLAGGLLVLAALDGFGRAAHPSATLAGKAAETLHQWAAAPLAGGALLLVFAWVRGDDAGSAPRRVAALAPLLALAAAATGMLSAGQALPGPSALASAGWGWALIAKVLLLLPLLAGVVLLWRSRARLGASTPMPLRLGALLAVPALLAAAVMPLMAAPGVQTFASLAQLDLPAAFPLSDGSRGVAHLVIQPGAPGESAVFVRLQREDGSVLPPSELPMLDLSIQPLDHPGPAQSVTLEPDPNGGYAFGAANVPAAGWVQATLSIIPPAGPPAAAPFWFVLPDPNVTGKGPMPGSDPAARAVFDRAITALQALRSVRYTQRLSDGNGSLYQSINEASDPMNGEPAAYRERNPDTGIEQIIVGDTQWTRTAGQPWEERAAASLYLPSQWWEVYQPATGLRLGPEDVVDGEPCRVVTFYLPRSQRTAPAWYAWWVGEETGRIRREAMVSQRHYMIYTFADFDQPLGITPPAERTGPPAGTPAP
ncbi:MAG: copper resistance protein CopC [Chloroflexota bacterium]